ncbi:MAG: methionine--tRNA ligase subunit beta [Candidatus Omnitrophota bacterium]
MVSFDEFKKLELKVGEIKEVKDHPNADKLYLISVDLGSEVREVVAGIKPYYKPEELVGKNVVVVANMEPANIRGAESKGMILAAQDESGICVLTTEKKVKPGSSVR